MKIIVNRWIPWKGYRAINLFGFLFVRSGKKLSDTTINHELIHTAQGKELWWIGFYLIYFFEWVVRLFLPGSAYRGISFEKEAYQNQGNPEYLKTRPRFAQWKKG